LIARILIRLIFIGLIAPVIAAPALIIKIKYVSSPIIIMFTNIALPFSLAGFLIFGGIYDFFIEKL